MAGNAATQYEAFSSILAKRMGAVKVIIVERRISQ
jgi:hypothetical protein